MISLAANIQNIKNRFFDQILVNVLLVDVVILFNPMYPQMSNAVCKLECKWSFNNVHFREWFKYVLQMIWKLSL